MLQQTTVATVIPYFERWMEEFPTVQHVAGASEEKLLSYWQGLGYYRRCKNIHKAAKIIAENGWPQEKSSWQLLPGIGDYTSGAITSIALSQATPAIDGNVERVYSRVHADKSTNLKADASKWVVNVIPKSRPGDFNQALMDLGATVCKPAAPLCNKCPWMTDCQAHIHSIQDQLPVPKKRPKLIKLNHVVWVPIYAGQLAVRQIPEGGWWQGMYEFPRVELSNANQLSESIPHNKIQSLATIKHTVTKHRITIESHLANTKEKLPNLIWCTPEELSDLPMPAPQRKIANLAIKEIETQLVSL